MSISVKFMMDEVEHLKKLLTLKTKVGDELEEEVNELIHETFDRVFHLAEIVDNES
tara:strand:+ start:85 stop:252 length:168 start_codon:yes stop_codon:yes gene_type:complete